MLRDELGHRMKANYEMPAMTRLVRRMPVAIRIDGKAFHTLTRDFGKPFDPVLMVAMQETMRKLCEDIQGCVFGYTESDEITLILIDYQTLKSDAWFDYEVQKMTSISASMATIAFDRAFAHVVGEFEDGIDQLVGEDTKGLLAVTNVKEHNRRLAAYRKAIASGAMFDSRCFNVPREEVTNLVYWRQLDARRNSVSMVAHAYLTQGEVHGKGNDEMQEMLFQRCGINWNDYPIPCKRGTACVKRDVLTTSGITRSKWVIDTEMPMLVNEGREYLDKLVDR